MSLAIKVENVSKAYQLGKIGTRTLSRDLERWWTTRIMGKEDPFLKIGETNDRSKKGTSDIVWSLKDINFEIQQGEAVGIIGRNGAGKSTLLKLLSRVTSPTTGNIKVKGRIASLLEVGTGFHPELSGKENIFLNGAILGMRKKEIQRKLDEIIDFSGVERYIDTPVKRYSSGMYVRLAFAVAAHLESEILIVDEVLSVGDAEFQKKCLGKMQDISDGHGRTVLFVSHNMSAIQSLCEKGIILNNGTMSFTGKINEAVNHYLHQFVNESRKVEYSLENAPGNDNARFISASVKGVNKKENDPIIAGEAIEFSFSFHVPDSSSQVLDITFHLMDEYGVLLFVGSTGMESEDVKGKYGADGNSVARCIVPVDLMNEGTYSISKLLLVKDRGNVLMVLKDVIRFDIMSSINNELGWMGKKEGSIKPKLEWTLSKA